MDAIPDHWEPGMAPGNADGQPRAGLQIPSDEIPDGFLDMESLEIGFHGERSTQSFRGQTDGQVDAVDFFDLPRLESFCFQ